MSEGTVFVLTAAIVGATLVACGAGIKSCVENQYRVCLETQQKAIESNQPILAASMSCREFNGK